MKTKSRRNEEGGFRALMTPKNTKSWKESWEHLIYRLEWWCCENDESVCFLPIYVPIMECESVWLWYMNRETSLPVVGYPKRCENGNVPYYSRVSQVWFSKTAREIMSALFSYLHCYRPHLGQISLFFRSTGEE